VYERYGTAGVAVLPSKYFYPFCRSELERAAREGWNEVDREKLREAYAVHYYVGTWWKLRAPRLAFGR
jgi:hypothetical protein